MAIRDNVRVRYRDGLILGADELVDDQTYFRAALERRSLARDMFGIAWGLDLALSGSVLRVSPGVAYGGDGKVIVVRESADLSPELDGKPKNTQWAVYVELTETTEAEVEGPAPLKYCGAPTDPRMLEGYRFQVFEVTGQDFATHDREIARLEPHANLAGAIDPYKNRVRLGVVVVNDDGSLGVEPTGRALGTDATTEVSPAGAQYIGVIAEGFMHPRRWSKLPELELLPAIPAIQLDPVLGIHLWEETRAHADLYFDRAGGASFKIMNDGNVLSVSHLAGANTTTLLTFSNQSTPGSSQPTPEVHVTVALHAEKDLHVTGTSTFSGLATMNGGLVAYGNTEVNGLQVHLDAKFEGKVDVNSSVTIKGSLIVGDATDPANPLGAPTTFLGGLDIAKTLSVTGGTTLTDLTATGETRLNAVIARTLEVTGGTTFADLTATGTTNLKVVNVESLNTTAGPITANSLTASTLTVNTTATLNGTTIRGASTVTGPATFEKRVVTKSDGNSGVCIDLPAGAHVNAGQVAIIDPNGKAIAANSVNSTSVIGIFAADAEEPGTARVVIAGVALGVIESTIESETVQPGDLLVAAPNGQLMKPSVPPGTGSLVAKALEPNRRGSMIRVLVTLG